MKKGQISANAFTYVAIVVIVGVILAIGYNFISEAKERIDESQLISLKQQLAHDIDAIGKDFGTFSRKTYSLSHPAKLCLVDLGKKGIVLNSEIINFYPLIKDSLQSSIEKNAYIVTDSLFSSYHAGNFEINHYPHFKCFIPDRNRIEFGMEGRGDKALILSEFVATAELDPEREIELESTDKVIKLVIPKSTTAHAGPTPKNSISIEIVDVPGSLAPIERHSDIYHFTPSGITFSNKIKMIRKFDASSMPGCPASLTLYQHNEDGSLKSEIKSKEIDCEKSEVTFEIDSFSYGYIGSPTEEEPAEEPRSEEGAEAANNAPFLEPIGSKTANENQKLEFNVLALDVDNDELTFAASALPEGAEFRKKGKLLDLITFGLVPSKHEFSWTPSSGQAGRYEVEFIVSDGIDSDSEAISINVYQENVEINLEKLRGRLRDEISTITNNTDIIVYLNPDELRLQRDAEILEVKEEYNLREIRIRKKIGELLNAEDVPEEIISAFVRERQAELTSLLEERDRKVQEILAKETNTGKDFFAFVERNNLSMTYYSENLNMVFIDNVSITTLNQIAKRNDVLYVEIDEKIPVVPLLDNAVPSTGVTKWWDDGFNGSKYKNREPVLVEKGWKNPSFFFNAVQLPRASGGVNFFMHEGSLFIFSDTLYSQKILKYSTSGKYEGTFPLDASPLRLSTCSGKPCYPSIRFGVIIEGFFWVSQHDSPNAKFHKYNLDGSYTGVTTFFSDAPSFGARAIVYDDFLWITDGKTVKKYFTNGTYAGFSFGLKHNFYSNGLDIIGYKNSLLLIDSWVGNLMSIMYKYTLDGVYTGVSIELPAKGCMRYALEGDVLWELNSCNNPLITKYDPSGGFIIPTVSVVIVDDGMDTEHSALKSPSREFISKIFCSGCIDAASSTGHGTGVAETFIRTAPGIEKVYNAKAGGDGISPALTWASDLGADIVQMSLGTDTCKYPDDDSINFKGFFSQMADSVFSRSDSVFAVGAGNFGTCGVGHYAGSFNTIVVGAVDDKNTITKTDDTITSFSSIGPTKDGRKKPDLVAPGMNINTISRGILHGTSLSTPFVSGAAAVLKQYELSSLGIKALLINSAFANNRKVWDKSYGWGELDMDRAFVQRDFVVDGMISPSSHVFYKAPSLSSNEKATLVWNRLADSNNFRGGSNNLDLQLYSEADGKLISDSSSEIDNVEQVQSDSELNGAVIKVIANNKTFYKVATERFALSAEGSLELAQGPLLGIIETQYTTLDNQSSFDVEVHNKGDLTAHNVLLTADSFLHEGFIPEKSAVLELVKPSDSIAISFPFDNQKLGIYSLTAEYLSESYGENFTGAFSATIKLADNDISPPVFENISYPDKSLINEDIKIKAAIADDSGINYSKIHYDYGNDGIIDGTAMMALADGIYEGIIPASAENFSGISFFIEAVDNDNNRPNDSLGINSSLHHVSIGAPTCTIFTYSDFGKCSPEGIQTRTILSSSPENCEGGDPITSQSCQFIPECTEAHWSASVSPTLCPFSGVQTRAWTKISACEGGVEKPLSEAIDCNFQAPACESFTYTNFTQCSSFGTQTREIISQSPEHCEGGNPITSQSCQFISECTESDWSFALTPSICPFSGKQNKTWTKVGTCNGGVFHPDSEEAACQFVTPTCTSFTYSNFSACSPAGVRTRTLLSSSPEHCEDGNPILTQECTFIPKCTDSDWSFALTPSICPASEEQTKTWTKIGSCEGGVEKPLSEKIDCDFIAPACTSFEYSEFSECSPSKIQTREVLSSSPEHCIGGNPITSQSCEFIPECTEADWSFSLSPSTCPASEEQTKLWYKIGICEGGIDKPGSEQISCGYQATTCTSYTYSNWSECSPSNVQTRTLLNKSPENCEGGNYVLTQQCEYIPECMEDDWSFTLTPSACPVSGKQNRTWAKIGNCEKGVVRDTEQISCDFQAPSCASFTYSNWSECSPSEVQARQILSSSPEHCEGGNPITSQSCQYAPLCAINDWTFEMSPEICPSTGKQTIIWTKIGSCNGGVTYPSSEQIDCEYQATTCTSFAYSNWSECSPSNVQTRTLLNKSPESCVGGNPLLVSSCQYIPKCTADQIISCEQVENGVATGYKNKCNSQGTAWTNESTCSIACNAGYKKVFDRCEKVDSNKTVFYLHELRQETKEGKLRILDDETNKTFIELPEGTNIASLTVKKSGINESKEYLIVDLESDGAVEKAVYIEKKNMTSNGICLLDEPAIGTVGSILNSCTKLNCPGSSGQYYCEISSNIFRISGLKHSGVVEDFLFCGDGFCSSSESCSSCGSDCGSCPNIQPDPIEDAGASSAASVAQKDVKQQVVAQQKSVETGEGSIPVNAAEKGIPAEIAGDAGTARTEKGEDAFAQIDGGGEGEKTGKLPAIAGTLIFSIFTVLIVVTVLGILLHVMHAGKDKKEYVTRPMPQEKVKAFDFESEQGRALLRYIYFSRSKGYPKQMIAEQLKRAGWPSSIINQAFGKIK